MNATAIPHLDHLANLAPKYKAIACDVWGVVHNGLCPYDDAVSALSSFRQAGGFVLLLTNAPRPRFSVNEQLDQIGVDAQAYDDVLTSGDVTRALLKQRAGEPAYHIGPDRDLPLFADLDMPKVEQKDAAYILCTGPFNDETETPDDYAESFQDLAARGVPMICANPDLVVDRGDQRIYCAGALAKAYEGIGGKVDYAGKPYGPVYDVARKRIGDEVRDSEILAIGDGVNTDIKGAIDAGLDALFITGGIHAQDAESPGGLSSLFSGFPRLPIAWQSSLLW